MALSGEDKFAILELVNRLYDRLDAHDGAGLASLFADDGRLVHGGSGEEVARDQIAAFVDSGVTAGNDNDALHLTANPLFLDDSETEPVLRVQLTKYRVSTRPPELWASVEVTMRSRQHDGVWKIAQLESRVRPFAV